MKRNNSILLLITFGFCQGVLAHSAGGPIDFVDGKNASATDVAAVQCSGGTDHLFIQIKDSSPAVPGLFVSMQVSKDGKMTNTTDTTPGDGQFSKGVILVGGNGQYVISVNKTLAGTRNIEADYHCEDKNGVHTDTSDLSVFQVQ